MKMGEYQFKSCFAPYLEKFISEKRAVGFIYESEEWKLKRFDAFCIESAVTEPCLSRDLVKEWGTLRDGEALATCSSRTSVLRQFALFLTSLGMEAYIPSNFYKAEKNVVHILSEAEIKAFFEAVDDCVPAIKVTGFHRLVTEYKVIFRLIYCCGLRISEARKLYWKDVDLQYGTIHISVERSQRPIELHGHRSD